MPLPIIPITIIEASTDVKEACSTSMPNPIECQLEVVDQDVGALLEVCFCQAPGALVHEPLVQEIANNVDLEVGRSLWGQARSDSLFAAEVFAAEVSRSREVGINKYSFKRTRASAEVPEALPTSVSLSPAPHHRYATDESTGECKTQ